MNFDTFSAFYAFGIIAVMVIVVLPSIWSTLKLNEPFLYHSFEEADEWHANAKRQHPVRYFLTEDVPMFFRRLNSRRRDLYYWVRNSIWDRHNVIVCRKLAATWCDRDHLMLHACFQILTDFVDKEKPREFSASTEEMREAYKDCSWCDERIEDWRELRELYQWWKNRDDNTFDKDEVDQLMLTRLIKQREYLWT